MALPSLLFQLDKNFFLIKCVWYLRTNLNLTTNFQILNKPIKSYSEFIYLLHFWEDSHNRFRCVVWTIPVMCRNFPCLFFNISYNLLSVQPACWKASVPKGLKEEMMAVYITVYSMLFRLRQEHLRSQKYYILHMKVQCHPCIIMWVCVGSLWGILCFLTSAKIVRVTNHLWPPLPSIVIYFIDNKAENACVVNCFFCFLLYCSENIEK